MKKNEYLNAYLNSWVGCDKDQLIKSLAESYEMDDPAAGHIPKPDMPGYMDSFKGAIEEMRGGDDSAPFIELSEKVVRDDADTMTAMIYWTVPGTPMEGGGWIKVGDDGVQSERLTSYTKPAE